MPTVSLKVPTIIREVKINDQRYYHIQPLFITHPSATNLRYENALANFKKEIKNYFKGFVLTRENMNELLWYNFNPEPKLQHVPINLKLGGRFIDGLVGAVRFQLQGMTFVCLPNIRNFMYISDGDNFKVEIERKVKKLFKDIEKDIGKDFEPQTYLSDKKEFLTDVDVSVRIDTGKFSFEASDFNFFSEVGNSEDFNGAVEVEKVGQCLNYLYPGELKRAFLREEEVEEIFKILFQNKQQQATALIGEIGVGRHTIVQEVLHRYLSEHYQKIKTRRRQIWQIDPNRVIAGMSIVGQWQKRFEAIISYLQEPFDSIDKQKTHHGMLIDNPVALLRVGQSAQNNMTLSDVLKPYIEERSLLLILLATPEEWKVVQEKDRRFADLFQVIRVQAADPLTASKMVLHQRRELEKANNCQFTIQAINQLFAIHRMYLKQNALPGGVMKLMNQLAVKYRNTIIDLPDVRKEFKSMSGLEEKIFEDTEILEPETVHADLSAKVVGQESAVKAIGNAVHLIKSRLASPESPISSYLFIGPTGVGKTQAAKVLCQYILGSEEHLLRFDMNEYIDSSAVDRLIGNAYHPEGNLTGKVRYRSFGVLLLDEIEKAHPSVHDLLLQVLDDGRLTDSLGRVVNFSNFIIIMTSNAGATDIEKTISTGKSASTAAIYRRAIERIFRPEFINRIDQVVVFNPLEREHILGIARIQIKELLQRDGFVRRTTILNISNETLDYVAQQGYDRSMGGRALKRSIEKELTALSAEQLISISSDLPIILDITYDTSSKKLTPKVHTLTFPAYNSAEQWYPAIVPPKEASRFYSQLLDDIKKLEQTLRDYRDEQILDEQDRYQYFQFANQLAELRDSITFTKLRAGNAAPPYTAPIGFKKFHGIDHINQEQITGNLLFEIRENFKYADFLFSKEASVLVNYSIDLLTLKINIESFQQDQLDRLTIRFHSLLDGFGETEINYLIENFYVLLNALEATCTIHDDLKTITAEGYGLRRLLQKEEGIHLFFFNYQTPVPIVVRFSEELSKALNIIRVYDALDTVTDFRSGISTKAKMGVHELKLMLLMSGGQ